MSQEINYREELSKCSTMADITGSDGLVQKIIKDAIELVLGREISEHIIIHQIRNTLKYVAYKDQKIFHLCGL